MTFVYIKFKISQMSSIFTALLHVFEPQNTGRLLTKL